MAKTDTKTILLQDLVLTVLKVILVDGREVHGPAEAILRSHRREEGEWLMEVWWRDESGDLIQFGYLAEGASVAQVCYTMYHRPSNKTSPIYSHPFDEVFHNWGKPMKLGYMGFYPAEKVWPELCQSGWYGDLPQFYN